MNWLRFVLLLLIANTAFCSEGVILLHGLVRTSNSMSKLESALVEAGYVVVNADYPSRSACVEQLAELVIPQALSDTRLKDCGRIHFITHSLGGILVRSYAAKHTIQRLGRVVMLGPPNQGSEVVDRLGSWKLFQLINGPAGSQLGTNSESLPVGLGPVNFELGVIAGDRSVNWINSVMIQGLDDGKVSVERTKVAGMKDHVVLHVTHPMMMRNKEVIDRALWFLKEGTFNHQVINNG